LVFHFVSLVPFSLFVTCVLYRSHLIDLHLKVLFVLQKPGLFPLIMHQSKTLILTNLICLFVQKLANSSLNSNGSEMLSSHRSRPRFLYDPTLSCLDFPLEVWYFFGFIPPMNLWRSPDHRINRGDRTRFYTFFISNFLRHTQSSGSLRDIL